MSISKSIVSNSYDAYLLDLIIEGEGFRGDVYLDIKNIPTIGYGFALEVDGQGVVRHDLDSALAYAGITWSTAQKNFIQDIIDLVNLGNVSQAQSNLQNAYNVGGIFYQQEISESDAADLFDYALDGSRQIISSNTSSVGNKTIGSIFQEFEVSHAETEELAAIYSMIYNLPTLFGSGLADALDKGDQARAWYEMLYNHGNTDILGLMNRRSSEADLFKIVGNDASIDEITLALNTLYNGQDYGGNDIYERIQQRDEHVNFEDKVGSYLQQLQSHYTSSNEIDYVQVADGEWINAGDIIAKVASGKS